MNATPSDPEHELALWAIAEKLRTIGNVADSREENFQVLAAIAEACWWIASLDERLGGLEKAPYSRARDADTRGAVIPGIRWARNRHTHDLIATGDGHVRPFVSDEPRGVLYISKAYRWRTAESMNLAGDSVTRGRGDRQRYVDTLVGKKIRPSLEGAHAWLTEAVVTFGSPST